MVVIWRRDEEKWGIAVKVTEVPQGHNPTLKHFSRLFLLNASTAVPSKCFKSWLRARLKFEARFSEAPDLLRALTHDDIKVPLRRLKELRLVLEEMPVGIGVRDVISASLRKPRFN